MMPIHAIAYDADPQPGYYRWRRARGAAWTPVVIYRPCPIDPDYGGFLDRWRQPVAMIDGHTEGDAMLLWPRLHAISRTAYERLLEADIPETVRDGRVGLAEMKPLF